MSRTRASTTGRALIVAFAISACVTAAPIAAQDPPDLPESQDEQTPPALEQEDGAPGARDAEASEETDDAPSLDDLLGIEGDDEGGDTAATRDADAELQRELDEVELSDAFQVALKKMSLSAEMLDVQFDAGIGTQRVQEDILARLQHLIEQARKLSQMSSASSSSSGDPSQSQQDPGPRQNQPPQQSEERASTPQDSQEGDPPPRQDGDINTVLDESRTEWGNLPERHRDMMSQGKNGRYSSLYRMLTEAYYQRLAEEGSP